MKRKKKLIYYYTIKKYLSFIIGLLNNSKNPVLKHGPRSLT